MPPRRSPPKQEEQDQPAQQEEIMVVTKPKMISLSRALQASGPEDAPAPQRPASGNPFASFCLHNKPPPPVLGPKGKHTQPSEMPEAVDLTSQSPSPVASGLEASNSPPELKPPASTKEATPEACHVRVRSKKRRAVMDSSDEEEGAAVITQPAANAAGLDDDNINSDPPADGKAASKRATAILSSPEDSQPGPSKPSQGGWLSKPGRPPAHPKLSIDPPEPNPGAAAGHKAGLGSSSSLVSMVQGSGPKSGLSPLTSPSLCSPSAEQGTSTGAATRSDLLGSLNSNGSRPAPQRLGGLGSLGSHRGSLPPLGALTTGTALRAVKLQGPAERQQDAQRALALQPAIRTIRRVHQVASDSDDEAGQQQEQPSLLRRVEEMSDKLRALLGAQQLDERFSAVSQEGMNNKVLVGREQVSEACTSHAAATLKGYQLVGINFLTVLSRSGTVGGAILADEMGLGKTAQTITFLGLLQHAAMKAWRAGEQALELGVQAGGRGPRPHLVICPASLLENWQRELKQWCPKLRVVVYYGANKERQRDILTSWRKKALDAEQKGTMHRPGVSAAAKPGSGGSGGGDAPGPASKSDAIYISDDEDDDQEERGSGSDYSGAGSDEAEEEDDEELFGFELSEPTSGESAPFDVLLTTYSLYERDSAETKLDRAFVSKWRWSHLVADEAHALKNRNSVRVTRLMKLARHCKHRILLTGTPIQNDIGELLNLLRFLMPSLFADVEEAEPEEMLGAVEESKAELTERVRRVMAPFILRRLKTEVATQLVEKAHQLIEVAMAPDQAALYQEAIKSFKAEAAAAAQSHAAASVVLEKQKHQPAASDKSGSQASKRRRVTRGSLNEDILMSDKSDASGGTGAVSRTSRGKTAESKSRTASAPPPEIYTIDEDDSEVEVTVVKAGRSGSTGGSAIQTARGNQAQQQAGGGQTLDGKVALAKLGAQRVNNIFAHLRKIALHPLLVRHRYSESQMLEIAHIAVRRQLFSGQCTLDKVTAEMASWSDHVVHDFACSHAALSKFKLPDDAVYGSGKVQHLLKLLPDLKSRGSRVLLFSQWTQMLDLLEWLMQLEGYVYVRLDGNTQVDERLSLVDRFNDPAQGVFVFLLSTRAGGQGLNLTGADTVVLHDVDFNPQVDRQAEDRCHRLGQTKPVTVYRLVTSGTVDRNIYEIAERKLQLDADIMNGVTVAPGDGAGEEGEEGTEPGAKGGKRGKAGAAKAAGKAGVEVRHMGAILAALLRDA